MEKHDAIIVICAPYKHLVKQWAEDVCSIYHDAKVILVSSENTNWEKEIRHAITSKRFHPEEQIIIISTITSFKMERFSNVFSKYSGEKLLIVDEAHRFTNRPDYIQNEYKYLLGLSATPFSGRNATKGIELMNFFGGQVYNLPIEDALARKFLVPYYYHPIFVNATEDEENKFRYYTKEQAKSIKKMLDQLEKIKQKGGSTIKSEYKIMSLKSAVNLYIKKMKEIMEKRLPATIYEYHKTETLLQKDIDRESKGIKEIPIYI